MKDERQIGYAKMQRLTLRIWTGYKSDIFRETSNLEIVAFVNTDSV